MPKVDLKDLDSSATRFSTRRALGTRVDDGVEAFCPTFFLGSEVIRENPVRVCWKII